MFIQLLLLISGFLLLIGGAAWLVDGASSLARRFNISELAIGLTVVAFGTSVPELVVNVFAAYKGHPDIVFGNVIGSNLFNLFVILGICGLVLPLTVQHRTVWIEIPISLLAAGLLIILVHIPFGGGPFVLGPIHAALFALLFLVFLLYVSTQLNNGITGENREDSKPVTQFRIWLMIAAGLVGLVAGGKLVVFSSTTMATLLGVSEKVIGLTIVAMGTSLPELATSLIAVAKKRVDIAVGNVVGSNIFNIFLILSVSGLISPLDYNPSFNRDLWMLIGGTLFLFAAMFTGGKKRLDRWEALLLLGVYFVYLIKSVSN